jgi:hypothetical protein
MATIHLKHSEQRKDTLRERKGRPIDTVLVHFQLIVVVLVFAIVGVSVLYLAEFNNLATQGVIIDELEIKRNRLVIENEVWRMRIAELMSLDVIKNQEVVQAMADVKDVQYVE